MPSVVRCRGAACRSRRCTNDSYRLPLKWQAPPNCHCEAPKGPWQSREGSGARVQGRRARENVAALSERHAGWQWLRHKSSGAKPPDLSLRGPEGAVAISGRQSRFCRNLPVIHPGPARFPRRFAPRNDNSGPCTIETMPKTTKSFPHCLGFQKRKGTHI